MRFTIVHPKNGHTPPRQYCDFQPPGGTIGRSVDNNLVLPDEERAISRLQAIVHVSGDGECRLTNRGNITHVILNKIPLERGREVELQPDDILEIGDYRIEISPLTGQQPSPATPTPQVPGDVWDSLMSEFPPPAASENTPPDPDDPGDNPLQRPAVEQRNPADPLAHFADGLELRHLSEQSTDPQQLFRDETILARQHILADTSPSALLSDETLHAAPSDGPQRDREVDPLALFSDHPTATAPDADPLALLMADAAPLANPGDSAAAPPQSPAPPAAPAPEIPPAAARPQAAPVVTRPAARRLAIDPVVTPTIPATDSEDSGAQRLDGPQLEALLQGLGLHDIQPQPQFDTRRLHQAGRLLSLFSQGTVALLSSRSILKRGVKAEMTMILDEANNPFKLLPSGKTVLMQMFGSAMPGFMPPEQAVRDALIDLQAHQLGMIAGIRAIIAAMLQSINPEQLEEEARQSGAAPRLALPSTRKAMLWDYFVRRYQQTAGEIEDDFHTLFGEAFLHAYDIEVNQYKDAQTQTDTP
ncbi:type VI secretion system-associated FHA domain protein TagH [Entomohabitans teleogrylli]|uniref:type VI secretion system-associated FHA domain protein TagH n=1 Tax=Entomohabitans teleogrylli TaxID=1384589 RepID=UPI00073D9DDD|nr:type VI secretion system-associated FHA domain protein TagH [Entomohabitans teleogrylli]